MDLKLNDKLALVSASGRVFTGEGPSRISQKMTGDVYLRSMC